MSSQSPPNTRASHTETHAHSFGRAGERRSVDYRHPFRRKRFRRSSWNIYRCTCKAYIIIYIWHRVKYFHSHPYAPCSQTYTNSCISYKHITCTRVALLCCIDHICTPLPPLNLPSIPPPPRYTFMVRTYVGAHMPLNIKSAFSRFHSANPSPPPPQDNPDPNDCTRDRGDGIYVYGASSENLWRALRRVFNTRATVYSGCMRCPVTFLFFLFLIIRSKTDFSRFPRGGYIYISHHHDPVVVHIASGRWCSVKYAPQKKYNIILWRSAGPI